MSSTVKLGLKRSLSAVVLTSILSPALVLLFQNCGQGFTTIQARVPGAGSQASAGGATVDTTPPTVTINLGPPALTNQTTFDVSFTAADAISGVASTQCAVDTGTYQACTSPIHLANLASGPHSLSIRSTDNAGNISVPIVWKWTIDLTAPTVTIATNPAAATNVVTAAFTFSGVDAFGNALSLFKCSLDAAAATTSACNSGSMSYSGLAAGKHVLSVTGTDAAGNSSAPAEYTWLIDLTAPAFPSVTTNPVIFTSNEQYITNLTALTFIFTTSDVGGSGVAYTQCSLDSAPFSNCTSPKSYSGLASNAQHTFLVRAIDNAGNTSGNAGLPGGFVILPDITAYTWTHKCYPTTNSFTATSTYTTAGAFSFDQTFYDTTCSQPLFRMQYGGTYTTGPSFPTADGRYATDFNGTYNPNAIVTPVSAAGVTYLNQNAVAGVSTWALNAAVTTNFVAMYGGAITTNFYDIYVIVNAGPNGSFVLLNGDRSTGNTSSPAQRPTIDSQDPTSVFDQQL